MRSIEKWLRHLVLSGLQPKHGVAMSPTQEGGRTFRTAEQRRPLRNSDDSVQIKRSKVAETWQTERFRPDAFGSNRVIRTTDKVSPFEADHGWQDALRHIVKRIGLG